VITTIAWLPNRIFYPGFLVHCIQQLAVLVGEGATLLGTYEDAGVVALNLQQRKENDKKVFILT